MSFNIIAQYSYGQHYFTFTADLEHFLVTNSATKATVTYPSDGLVIRMDAGNQQLLILASNTENSVVKETYYISRNLDYTGIMVDVRPKLTEPTALRSVLRVTGIGVTVLLDIDPVKLEYHTLDFEGIYQVVVDGNTADAIASHIRFNLVQRTNLNATFSNPEFNYNNPLNLKMLAVTANLDLVTP